MAPRYRTPGIEVLEYVTISDPDVQGTRDAWWGTAKVHAKAEEPDVPLMLANELICCRLAAAVGLPVLPGEIAIQPATDRRCWITPQIAIAGGSLPPPDPAAVVAQYPNIVAGMVAFDEWVRNDDRHSNNLLYDPRLGLWLIDHEHSLAGPAGESLEHLKSAIGASVGYHEFRGPQLDAIALRFWAQRISMVHAETVDRAVNEAFERGLMKASARDGVRTFLLNRRKHVVKLVEAYGRVNNDELPDLESGGDGAQLGLFDEEGT